MRERDGTGDEWKRLGIPAFLDPVPSVPLKQNILSQALGTGGGE
jgi:hypothetical protein